MQKHVKVYLKYFEYGIDDFIPCEVCGSKAVDIHHIVYRSKFGAKRKGEQDHITNLIALCRTCHDKAHNEEITKEKLTKIHNTKLRLHEL